MYAVLSSHNHPRIMHLRTFNLMQYSEQISHTYCVLLRIDMILGLSSDLTLDSCAAKDSLKSNL